MEKSWTLDIAGLPLHGPLSYPHTGTLKAIRIVGDRKVLRVRYALLEDHDGPILNLTYTPELSCFEGDLEERLRLLTTKANFGGVRWWLACPFTLEGERCDRRVAKLYLPPEGHKFGCRTCHNLTYESSQQSHKYDGLAAVCAGGERSGEAYKAFRRYFSTPSKELRKRRKKEATSPTLLAAFEREFGLGKW